MIDLEGRVVKIIERQEDMLGNVESRAYTATLRVSPDGNNADGLSWRTAFTTVNDALDAASPDANDLTLILIAPHATYYDINLTGTPEWAANVVLKGSYRYNTQIRNTHGAAGCIMQLTGKSVIMDLCFHLHTDGNGVIMEHEGARAYRCCFDGTLQEDAAICLWFHDADHSKAIDCDFFGNVDWTIALKIEDTSQCDIERLRIHDCERGIWIQGATSDHNLFNYLEMGHCALALDLDGGNEQVFSDVLFHHNTRNVDAEVQDHHWLRILGAFPIYISPDNFTGIAVACGGAGNTYGGDTELIAAAAIDNPFTVIGVNFGPDATPAEWYMVRFSADSGVTWYDVLMFSGDKREGIAAPPGTEFIHNADTRISCSAKSVSGGNNVDVWVEIQEI